MLKINDVSKLVDYFLHIIQFCQYQISSLLQNENILFPTKVHNNLIFFHRDSDIVLKYDINKTY